MARFILILSIALLSALGLAAQRNAATRSITIVSEPKTSVWVDSVMYGKTNAKGILEIASISTGAKMLKFRADGFKEKSQPLNATQKGEIIVSMTPTTDLGELKFQEAERLATTNREKAAAAYEEAIKLRPTYTPAYISLARVEIERNEFDSAQSVLRRLKKVNPRNAEASAVEGRLFSDTGEDEKAVAAYKRAIVEGRGVQPEAYTGLGLLYKELGDGSDVDSEERSTYFEESTKNFRSALKQLGTSPDAVVIYQLLGLNLERQKKYADAIKIYEEFLRLFPAVPEATSVKSYITQLRKQMDGDQ